MEKLTRLASMIFEAKKDLARRENHVLENLSSIIVEEDVPEGYAAFMLYGGGESFEITEKPDGSVSITN